LTPSFESSLISSPSGTKFGPKKTRDSSLSYRENPESLTHPVYLNLVRTDRRTDGITIASTRLHHVMSRVKKNHISLNDLRRCTQRMDWEID